MCAATTARQTCESKTWLSATFPGSRLPHLRSCRRAGAARVNTTLACVAGKRRGTPSRCDSEETLQPAADPRLRIALFALFQLSNHDAAPIFHMRACLRQLDGGIIVLSADDKITGNAITCARQLSGRDFTLPFG